jgi:hypothetical protein
MRFGNKGISYEKDHYDALYTNGKCDVLVKRESQIVDELDEIGFVDISAMVMPGWPRVSKYGQHEKWIYVKGTKR